MHSKPILFAASLIAALISFGNAFVALFMQNSGLELGGISTATWVVMGVGALLNMLKDFYSILMRDTLAGREHRPYDNQSQRGEENASNT